MPRVCTICTHPRREEIDKGLVAGDAPVLRISSLFGVSESALRRHKRNHLPAGLVKVQEVAEAVQAMDVMTELQRAFHRVNLLFDACDRWLRDPDNPSRYEIGPRAEDVMVTYWEDIDGKPTKGKAKLSTLLAKVSSGTGGKFDFELVEIKHADPRELILKTAQRLQGQLELIAQLIGELDKRPVVNVLLSPQWVEIRGVLLNALEPFPKARQAAAAALLEVEGDERGD